MTDSLKNTPSVFADVVTHANGWDVLFLLVIVAGILGYVWIRRQG